MALTKKEVRIAAERAACRDGGEQMQDVVIALLVDAEHAMFFENREDVRKELARLIEEIRELDPGETPTYEIECLWRFRRAVSAIN